MSTAAEPPVGLFPGAVDTGHGTVTFALYAPGKQSVSLIGDFNGWDRQATPLYSTPQGLWWIECEFQPGSYEYQFAIDAGAPGGETVICDPYARELVDDSAFDPPRARVDVGRPPFAWQHDVWQRPALRDLVLMEIHVGDFSPDGFEGVRHRLDYLRDLGINAIELMPIFEFKGDLGWGYNPAYFFTVEKSYGTSSDLCTLIDDAHANGIAVILDLVLAHTAHRHPFNKLYLYDESPWYGPGCGEPNQFGFPTLDYTKGPTQDFSRDVQDFWVREFHVDGFRYDYCHGIGCRGALGMPHLISCARAARPDIYLIAEYSPEKPEEVGECDVDAAWHIGVSYAIKALLCEDGCGDFAWDDFARCLSMLDPWASGYTAAQQMVNFLESHDEQRVVYDMYSCGHDQPTALLKSALGAIVLLTMPGHPMLYHGQELGEGTPRLTNERNFLHWEALQTPGGERLHDHYKKLASLRHNHPALRGESYLLDALDAEQHSAVYHRWHDDGDEVVVALNFSPQEQTVRVPFPRPAKWHDEMGGQILTVEGHEAHVLMPPSTGAVFVKME